MTGHDDLERELRALRDEPSPEWAQAMDERAAREIASKPRRRLRLNVLGPVAATGLAAVVAVVVLTSEGEDDSRTRGDAAGDAESKVAAPAPSQGASGALAITAVPAPAGDLAVPRDAAPQAGAEAAPESGPSRGAAPLLTSTSVSAGAPLTVTYTGVAATSARVTLARSGQEPRSGTAPVPAGTGALRIATRGLAPGSYRLQVKLRGAGLDTRVRIRP